MLDDLDASAVAAVLANRNTGRGNWPYVGGDERGGIALAVAHLAGLGHRRLLHLAGPQNLSTGRDRADAFRASVRAARLPATGTATRVCHAFTERAGAEAMAGVLSASHEFTAVVAGNDLIALGALDVLRQARISCPRDVSVTGFNDMPFVDRLTPPLTTVRLPLEEMGRIAARALLDQLRAAPATRDRRSTLLPADLIVRGTTARAGAGSTR